MSDEFTIADPRFAEDRHVYTAPLSDDEMGEMFADIAAVTVDETPTFLGRLRQQSTPVRVLLGLSAAAVFSGIVIAILGIRGDLTDAGREGMLLSMGVMALLGVASMTLSLRSLHSRSLGALAWLFAGFALLIPPIISFFPGLWPGDPDLHNHMPWESGCFWFGAAVASTTGASVLLLQRSSTMAIWRVLTAAAAGGFAGFITQQIFCPASGTWHIFTAHGLLGLVVSGLLLTGIQIKQKL